MRLKLSFLASKVSRRIFILFVLAALIPIVITGMFSYKYVFSILNSQKNEYLTAASKSYGMTIYDRMLVAEVQFNLLVDNVEKNSSSTVLNSNKTRALLNSTTVLFSDTEIYQKPTNISSIDLKHLQDGHSKVSISDTSDGLEIYLSLIHI